MSLGHFLFPAVLFASALAVQHTSGAEPKQSRNDLEKAATNGNPEAQYQLGLLLRREGKDGESEREALAWFRKAAGQRHMRAQYEMAQSYQRFGSEENLPLAEKWLTRSAGQGYGQAWLALGNLYARGGSGVLQDFARAQECYQKADENGDAEVWHELGQLNRRGESGIAENLPRALEMYMKAARHGNTLSQYFLGEFYEYGMGTAPNLAKAVYRYTEAAKCGQNNAQAKLGWFYEHGIGVVKDREQAIAWYKKAEQHGGSCWGHLMRLKDPETLKRHQKELERERIPIVKDVEITLEPEKAEYELDELIVITIRYRNVGKETYSFSDHHDGGFRYEFSVTNEEGRRLPNSYADLRTMGIMDFMSSIHVLEPGKTVVLKKTLNQCAHFEKPGTYTVSRGAYLLPGKDGWRGDGKERREVKGTPLTLKLRKSNTEQRQKDIERLVKAYREDSVIPKGMTYPAEEYGGRLDIMRRLVFYNEPKLLSFFLDELEKDDVNGFIETGLQALPDRSAVLKAIEERVGQPEKYHSHHLLQAYLYLAGYRTWDSNFDGEPRMLNDRKSEAEITRKCQAKVLLLLQGDKQYRYGHLVPGLLGGSDDLFLIDYLSRCRPNLDLVRRCAGTIQKVKLAREHIPFLESLLKVERDSSVTDAAILQLVRLDRDKYLPQLRERRENFSPAIVKMLLDPSEE